MVRIYILCHGGFFVKPDTIVECGAFLTVSGSSLASLAIFFIAPINASSVSVFRFGRLDHHRFFDDQRKIDCRRMKAKNP